MRDVDPERTKMFNNPRFTAVNKHYANILGYLRKYSGLSVRDLIIFKRGFSVKASCVMRIYGGGKKFSAIDMF